MAVAVPSAPKVGRPLPWCITLDNSKGISRLRFWAKKRRVNGINDLPVFMHQGTAVPATGEPDSAPRTTAPGACTPAEAPSWFRNSHDAGL